MYIYLYKYIYIYIYIVYIVYIYIYICIYIYIYIYVSENIPIYLQTCKEEAKYILTYTEMVAKYLQNKIYF